MTLNTTNKAQRQTRTTIALEIIVHGEAVRYNRGQAGSQFDFKHMTVTGKNDVIPYVSSQCFKKHWRETLPDSPSPITIPLDAKGQVKNQAYTSGDPMK